jgi:DNA-binding response OmpR family regulator
MSEYGCDDFITKPFDLEEFIGRVKNLSEKRTDNKTDVI